MKLIVYQTYQRVMHAVMMLVAATFFALPAQAAAGTADLMLVLDESGSILGTDPNNVRYTAVQQMMNSLAGGSTVQNAGLIFFNGHANVEVPLSNISTAVPSINTKASGAGVRPGYGGSTDTAMAIQTGISAFTNSTAATKVMLVFTDGAANDPNAAAAAAADAAARGITVHIIALGQGAAAAATPIAQAGKGRVLEASDTNQLLSLFSAQQIFGGGTNDIITKTIATAVTPQIQRATSVQQATTISNVLSNIFSSRAPNAPGAPMRVSLGNQKGMAAGGSPAKFNAWVNASDTTIGSNASSSLFDGTVTNALGGVDYRVSDKFVAGVSVGYDRVDLDYKFAANSGMLSEGWLVAPYASYQVSDIISVDGAYGYAEGDADNRANGVTQSQGYNRQFLALNLNANYWMGDLQLTGKTNYIFTEEKMDTTNKMEQLRLGGQVGYWIGGIMPYAGISYVRDLKVSSSTPGGMLAATDKDAWVGSVGVNFFSKGAFSAGISYTEEFDRVDSKNYTFMANVGYRF